MTVVAGVFSSKAQAETLLPELKKIGINNQGIELIAGSAGSTQRALLKQSRTTGQAAIRGILPGALFATFVGAILLTIARVNPLHEPVAAAIYAAGIAFCALAGATMAAMFNMGRSHDQALLYEEALKTGEVIAAVEVTGPDAHQVVHVFETHHARNVKAGNWRAPGWNHPFPADSSVTS